MKNHPQPPIYSQVAFDIAKKIATGEMKEGFRFTGRSLLSTEYNVSPETIRRALKQLSDMEIVTIQPQVGTMVTSRERARAYIEKFETGRNARDLRGQLDALVKERDALNEKITLLTQQLLDLNSRFHKSDYLENYEFELLPGSPLCGRSLGDSDFRRRTGGTIVAVRRNQAILLSPGADFIFEPYDILLAVGAPEVVERIMDFIAAGKMDPKNLQEG